MKIKNYTTMKVSETFCSLKTTATVILVGVLLLTNTAVNAQNNALDFDGVDDYVTLPTSINDQITTNNVTVEGWFNIESIGNQVTLVGEWYDNSDQNVKFALYYDAPTNEIVATLSDDGSNLNFPFLGFARPALNTWVHIAATYDGSNLRLYYNGVQVNEKPATMSLPTTGNGLWVLGKRTDGPDQFKGKIDEVRIWNVARSASDILANYRNQVPPTAPNLVAYYQMDQGVAGGNNAVITSLVNSSNVPSLDGTLQGPFALTGSTSNFVETGIPTVYNGTWSQGAPNASRDAVIEGNYSVAANLAAKTLTVNNNAAVTIPSGNNANLTGALTVEAGSSFTLENNANLIQVDNVANTGAGTVTVKRNSNLLKRLDYTLWSSPVTGTQTLAQFSPLTSQSPNRFYTYDTSANAYAATSFTNPFSAGTGYLIRMPNTSDAVTPTAYPGEFTGTSLNNGNVSVTLSTAGSAYNLVGNPYPSTINLFTLLSNNTGIIGSTFYMWRGTNGAGSAYCSYLPTTTSTGTYVSNGNLQAPVSFTGDILSGQGFFVSATTAGPLVFNNGQRVSTASSFFKTKQVATADKVWLNATTAAGAFSQMAVTYFDGATQGVDAFDGKYINDSAFALTSNINNGEFTIQGRPAFDVSDIVALNFKTDASGDYTIAIDHSEGVFATGQAVYLLDSKTGAETNLKEGAYNFTATAGVDNSRFSLKYQKTLKVTDSALNDNSVIVYINNGALYVNSSAKAISAIKVYDVQGRLLAERTNVKTNTATISNLKTTSDQILIVQVRGEDNSEVTKKVVN